MSLSGCGETDPLSSWLSQPEGLRARFGTSPSSFCWALERSVWLKLMRVSYWGLRWSFCHQVLHTGFFWLLVTQSDSSSVCRSVWVRWQLYVTTEFTANTQLRGQDTMTSWDLSTESIPVSTQNNTWKTISSFGLPRDTADALGWHPTGPSGWAGGWSTWCVRTERGFGSFVRRKLQLPKRGQEESQDLHRGAQQQDRIWWGQATVGDA